MANLNTSGIINAAISDVLATGRFDRANTHEPKSSPGSGLTAALWMQRIAPVAANSGLAATSAVLLLNIRLYTSMKAEPEDAIDASLADAVDALMTTFNGGFSFNGLIREIDLLGGESGIPLAAEAGYITIGGTMYRCVTITVPCLVDDIWPQAA